MTRKSEASVTMSRHTNGTVYLIHFDRPYRHARHYLGYTEDLQTRMTDHANGRGARLMAVITDAGIEWQLARTWRGGRRRERQLKRQGGASRLCPCCGVRPRDGIRFASLPTAPTTMVGVEYRSMRQGAIFTQPDRRAGLPDIEHPLHTTHRVATHPCRPAPESGCDR